MNLIEWKLPERLKPGSNVNRPSFFDDDATLDDSEESTDVKPFRALSAFLRGVFHGIALGVRRKDEVEMGVGMFTGNWGVHWPRQ
jgi:hypothetical protein